MPRLRQPSRHATTGFTLVELAMVLIIVGLLVGGMLVSLSTQREIASAGETQRKLDEIKDTILGFTAANSRLPCPAIDAIDPLGSPFGGREAFCTTDAGACAQTTVVQNHGRCANNINGFLPAITLGIAPTDAQGFAIDSWGNRIRYSVTSANSSAFTAAPANNPSIKSSFAAGLGPNLIVCSQAPTAAPPDCNAGTWLADSAVAVLVSPGRNGATAAVGPDEQDNADADRSFVSRLPGADGAGAFDDIVTWISPNILYNRLITAGRIP